MIKWINAELKNKACEMLDLDNHFPNEKDYQDLGLDCLDNSTSFSLCADT